MRAICLALLLFSANYLLPTPTSESTSNEQFCPAGRHLVVELSDCTFPASELNYEILLWYAAYKSGAEVLEVSSHTFPPQGDHPAGWTGIALLGESHISVHTWPEHKYVALDVFTCGKHVDMMAPVMFFINLFDAQRVDYAVVDRGYYE